MSDEQLYALIAESLQGDLDPAPEEQDEQIIQ
jgi:hypothetical protein